MPLCTRIGVLKTALWVWVIYRADYWDVKL